MDAFLPLQTPNQLRKSSVARCLFVALLPPLLIAGCDVGDRVEPRTAIKAEVGPIPPYPQRPGDPAKGYDALLNRAPLTCGLPFDAYLRARGEVSEAPGPRFPGRTGRNAELPYGLTASVAPSGVELVTTNCLSCHAAVIDGRLVMGVGNALLDLTRDALLAVESFGELVHGGRETAEWRRWADRVGALADALRMETVGVSPGLGPFRASMAHRDPQTLAWSDLALIPPPSQPPLPVGIPPWWNLRKKNALYSNGEGRGDQVRLLMLASITCTDSVEEARAMESWFVDIRAYLATLEPPGYPDPVDRPLVNLGARLFRAHCQACHGTYGPTWRYPNRVIALGEVGTDPELARAAYFDSDRFLDWLRRSFYGELSQSAPALGYLAPPLDGVWATAPYLHNDSVPTLADLLDGSVRPAYWALERDEDGTAIYDPGGVGWRYRRLSAGKSSAMSWGARNRIYDTTQRGYGNWGHRFGDGLEVGERRALIEYLKTL